MTTTVTSRSEEFEALLLRHGVDLSRAPSTGRLVVPCIIPPHDDRRPSLSIDVPRSLFHCFACGAGGGFVRLRELLLEGPGPSGQPMTPAQKAVRAREVQRREAERIAGMYAQWIPASRVRRQERIAQVLRQYATQLGPDHRMTWALLEQAVRVETQKFTLEEQLDDAMRARA